MPIEPVHQKEGRGPTCQIVEPQSLRGVN